MLGYGYQSRRALLHLAAVLLVSVTLAVGLGQRGALAAPGDAAKTTDLRPANLPLEIVSMTQPSRGRTRSRPREATVRRSQVQRTTRGADRDTKLRP
jgi:hypothetical protein